MSSKHVGANIFQTVYGTVVRSFHSDVGIRKRCVVGLLCLLTTFLFIFLSQTNVLSSSRLQVAVQSSPRRFKSPEDGFVVKEKRSAAAAVAEPTNLPEYVEKWYDELRPGSAGLRPRRLFASFVVVSDRSQYDNDAALLSSWLNALAAEECIKQQADDVDVGYQLYVIGPGDHMPSTTTEIESTIANTLRSSNCTGEVTVSVRAVNEPMTAALNKAALDAYLDREAGYFRLALPGKLTKLERTRPLSNLLVALDDHISPGGLGMIVEVGNSTSEMTSVFFGAGHFEVFGWLLPPDVVNVLSGLRMLITSYEGHNLTQFLAPLTTTTVASESSSWRGNLSFNLDMSSPQYSDIRETLNRYLIARSASRCWRCRLEPDAPVRVISMSLYGSSRRYTAGAVRNAQLLPVTFPGWRLRIYCELSPTLNGGGNKYAAVPTPVLRRLVQLGADLYPVDTKVGGDAEKLAPMLWRFAVAVEEQVDAFVVRDADSRLTPRDGAVVVDWLTGHPDSAFHCVRDHPSHSSFAISGGLWGGQPRLLSKVLLAASPPLDFNVAMRGYSAAYIDDMNFLCRDIWPRVQAVAYCHDSFSCDRYAASHPFPVARIGSEHLGEVYNEYTVGRDGDISLLRNAPVNPKCVP